MDDLKEDLKKGKPIYGTENTIKKIKLGKMKKIYVASNCKDKQILISYAQQFGVDVVELEENNAQLGVICKRPHLISVLGFQ
jgi:ribosomal protein L30E